MTAFEGKLTKMCVFMTVFFHLNLVCFLHRDGNDGGVGQSHRRHGLDVRVKINISISMFVTNRDPFQPPH